MKIFNNLLVRVICGILLGILLGNYAPEWLYRILLTFQSLFSNFLKFAIPLIMMGLIMPSIADLGKNAGKLLLITVGIAYVFTLFSGFSTYLVGEAIFPSLLQGEQLASLAENSVKSAPYFTIEMPPLADVMSALVFSFIIGIGLSFNEESKLTDVIREFGDIIKWLIVKAIIPILPFYILCIFAEITYSGQVVAIMEVFFKLIVILFAMHICLLIIQYLIAGGISGKNPFKALGTMLPAYATALGTQSSAATIPVTLRQSLKLGISQRIAGFVIPLCATIHLSGSTMKITACALALMMLQGVPYDFSLFAGFILMLGVVMIAAPGVPGGAIMATLGVLNTILGFDESLQGLMVALYIAMDSFGTACNVTGDGAVALIVDKIAKRGDRR
ncbi:dicarboxylate/amino acid:cation symporter [Capnocytophaga sp. oral taxon 326]|uniref:dicarboxylate/amino acid:cation symporter n=1 Tax=Capnocytophaga sp. oral taxon 326 TaxID=712212 RepID=UPI0002A1EB00|nr:dicarboxylate/amino acid:cation symporter [Capnocytophaga sp. oral taxon 326]EKY19951.1 transporter, dicarboxylate/amino acid:cation Na+/H+ symporter family protein [Capnocytophaga sp. oral taxon 326 str. F0382]